MSRTSTLPADRNTAQREGLLSLTRLLVSAPPAGTFSEALDIVTQTLGVESAAAYEVDRDDLVLVSHCGLSLDLRTALERLPRGEDPWFIAARAAKSRRLVTEADVAASTSKVTAAALFPAGARLVAAAVPLVAGREVLGVLVLLHKRADAFDAAACAFLETAAGLITLARKAERGASTDASLRRDDARVGPLTMAGMLAAHFADDVRGPLAAIGLALREEERILDRSSPMEIATSVAPALRQIIQESQLALARAQAVNNQIVAAAKAGPKEKIFVADVLRDAVGMVTPLADARGVLITQQIAAEGRVLGRRAELVPAFVALLTNAVQACEHGLRTRRPTVRVSAEDEPRGVAVSIEDTGPGVPADLRSRIFDPFFSTNEGASGIGLTLAKHAIVGHSGHLEIAQSTSLGGAIFRAVLPRAADTRRDRRTSLSSATLRRLAPRPALLWIDRDRVLLTGARRALDGFELRVAGTVAEGEQMVLHGEPPPEIVFCELDLPDGSGIDLHACVARRSADLASRFVFLTDGILSPERAAYVLGSGCPSLVKPLDLDEIRLLVQTASGERDSPSSRSAVSSRRGAPDTDEPF
jgi:signal transduction histidine kinase/ActR/RegA family two-component response regulator